MKKIVILAAVSALMMAGCSSITTEPKNDEVIPYEQDHSLAWNVMNQIESADKLYDVETMEGDSVIDTSALGHIGFALLSGNLFGGLAASVITDTKGHISYSNFIMSLDLSKAPNGNLKLEVANQFIESIKTHDNIVISDFKESWFGYRFIERGDGCTRALQAHLNLHPDSERVQKRFNEGYCATDLHIDIIGPTNSKIFKNTKGFTTVRVRPAGYRHSNSYVGSFKDVYLFHSAYQYPGSNNISAPFIEYNDSAYLFMKKTEDGKEQVVPFSEMPNQKYLMLGR
jgi:uncharacterized protein YceK